MCFGQKIIINMWNNPSYIAPFTIQELTLGNGVHGYPTRTTRTPSETRRFRGEKKGLTLLSLWIKKLTLYPSKLIQIIDWSNYIF